MHISATEAKNRFGYVLDRAQHEPMFIEKNGRSVAIVMSNEEYERIKESEDKLWELKAKLAKEEGFLSQEESENFLNEMLNVEN